MNPIEELTSVPYFDSDIEFVSLSTKKTEFLGSVTWPPMSDTEMESTVTAFCEMSDLRIPKPYNNHAANELDINKSNACRRKFHGNISVELNKRMQENVELGAHIFYDLGNMPVIETHEELKVSKMTALCHASVKLLTKNIYAVKSAMDDYSKIVNLAGIVLQSGREDYQNEEIGVWNKETIETLKKFFIDLSPTDTSSQLYEKLSVVWAIAEKCLISTSMQWLQSLLDAQRLKFYLEVGQHLSAEASMIAQIAIDKSYQHELSSFVEYLHKLSDAPFLMEWPTLIDVKNN